jgi:DNA-binding response OmpR family regulator
MRGRADTSTSQSRDVVGAELLVVDRDPQLREGMGRLFGGGDINVTAIADPAEAWALLDQRFFSVVLLDLDTPLPGGGIETAGAVAVASPTSAIVMLTPRRSFDDAVAAVRAGAIDVIVKAPESVGYLRERIKAAATRSLARRRLRSTLAEVREFHEDFLRRFMEVERRVHELSARPTTGKDGAAPIAELTLFLVSADADLAAVLAAGTAPFRVVHATSGGEALDRSGNEEIHLALVSEELTDLPVATVMRSLRTAHPECLMAAFSGPRPGAKVEIVEGDRRIPVVNNFASAAVLAGQLDELAEATRARLRERSFLMGFRERNYELIRKFARLKQRLESE